MEKYREFSRGIDYLTVRVRNTSRVFERASQMQEGDVMPILGTKYYLVWGHDCTDNKRFRVLRLKDEMGNVMGQLKIVKDKGNMQIFDEIELQGAYWISYAGKDLKEILELFDVDIMNHHGISRIDYRFDILASSHKVFCANFYNSEKQIRTHRKLGKVTWCMSKSDRIELVAYDKKLDILENESKRNLKNSFFESPYQKYMDCEDDITRVEYRKNSRALRETKRTIMEEMAYIEADAIEYARENFGIILENRGVHRRYKEQTEQIVKQIEKEKIARAGKMVEAYARTMDSFGAHKKLVQMLYERYGTQIIRELQDAHFVTLEQCFEMKK